MKLIIGLGNPGPQYLLNRHNIGFTLCDALADHYSFRSPKRHGQSLIAEGLINECRVLLLKPLTFMNLSGQAAGEVVNFFKIPLEDIIVIHDDLDLAFATVRIKNGGGHGGHNGLRNLDATIGKDYWRVRIGIGHPGIKEEVTNHVLGNFSKNEQKELVFLIQDLINALPLLLSKNTEQFLKMVNQHADCSNIH